MIIQLANAGKNVGNVAGTRFLEAFEGKFDLIQCPSTIMDDESLHNFADERNGLW